jgi:hypothetical protein
VSTQLAVDTATMSVGHFFALSVMVFSRQSCERGTLMAERIIDLLQLTRSEREVKSRPHQFRPSLSYGVAKFITAQQLK